jgi:hypothetical protein
MEILRYAGFAEEATFAGTPPSAQFCVDIASASLEAGADAETIYKGSLGRSDRVHRPGFYSCEGDIEYGFDIRTIGWLLKWALGGYVCTGETAPYLHEIYGDDDLFLPTFCAKLGKDKLSATEFEHVFIGCGVDAISMDVKDGYATAKVGIKSSKDIKGSIMTRGQVEDLLPAEYQLMFHEVTVSRGNSDISAKVKGFKLDIKNGIKPESGRSLGSRYVRRLPAGGREVTFSLDMYYADLDTLELLWGGSTGPTDTGSTEFPLTITFDAGEDGQLQLIMPRCVFGKVPVPIKGQDEAEMNAEGKAYVDTVTLQDNVTEVETEIMVRLQNDQFEMTPGGS